MVGPHVPPHKGRQLAAPDPITTSVTDLDGIAAVNVGGEIDLATASILEAAIAEALAKGPAALIIDLSEVTFLASAGLQILVATNQKVNKSARFAVVANGPATSRPIQLTGLDEIIPLYPTFDDALKAVRSTAD
jgi:anti-sigma B factor antagonist